MKHHTFKPQLISKEYPRSKSTDLTKALKYKKLIIQNGEPYHIEKSVKKKSRSRSRSTGKVSK